MSSALTLARLGVIGALAFAATPLGAQTPAPSPPVESDKGDGSLPGEGEAPPADPASAAAEEEDADTTEEESAVGEEGDAEDGATEDAAPVADEGAVPPEGEAPVAEEAAPPEGDAPSMEEGSASTDAEAVEGEVYEEDGAYDYLEGANPFNVRLYGYIDGYFEQVAPSPAGVGPAGETIFESNPFEFNVLNFHVMSQGTIFNRFRFFFNLAAQGAGSVIADEPIALRNAWVETPTWGDYLNIRFGKTYRRFGLYNEILDATPTFIGIEPPELFDPDHLMLTRTTNLMIHGSVGYRDHIVKYALMTGNDESGGGPNWPTSFDLGEYDFVSLVADGVRVPIGLDVRYEWADVLILGTSFYTSNGSARPSRTVGEGPPRGGVANWMANDHYVVGGAFAQLSLWGFLFQVEYWLAHHDARRDPHEVLKLLDADLNPRQREMFGLNGAEPDVDDVATNAIYQVHAFYIRTGYAFDVDFGGWLDSPWQFTPYAQVDYYRNPESVRQKSFGGDNEAGLADDGQFLKLTGGLVYRPIPAAALKIDTSTHVQMFNQGVTFYPEIRVSYAYYWELGGLR